MIIRFLKKIIVKGKENIHSSAQELANLEAFTLTPSVLDKGEEGDRALNAGQPPLKNEGLKNKTGRPIPHWASTWLRKPGADNTRTIGAKGEGETHPHVPPPSGVNELTDAENANRPDPIEELPTADYLEPRNFEVREMVLRQIQTSRSVARYMCSTNDLVEDQIQKAMERGDFNNLKGKNQPLKFEENAYEDPELRLPFKILKDAGFAPYWVEEGKEIDAAIANCHMTFDKFMETLAYRRARYGYLSRSPEFERRVMEVMTACAHNLEEANKKIDKYNMIVPMYWLQRKKLDTKAEMQMLQERLDEFLWGTIKGKKEKTNKDKKKKR